MMRSEHKRFIRFLTVWTGQLLSGIGSGMTAFAIGVHVFRRTGSATGFAMVILALFLPSIILRPLGGLLADRFDRRLMIILGDLGSAAGILFLLLSLRAGELGMGKIYFGVGIVSAFSAIQNPAYKASLTDLLDESQFAKAAGLVQLAASAQHLLAPVCAGLLMAGLGLEAVLLLDLATFALAMTSVGLIRVKLRPARQGSRSSAFVELKQGWRAVADRHEVLEVVVMLSLVTFFVGVLQTLFPPMVLSVGSSRTLGIIQSTSAVGMILGSLAIGLRSLSSRIQALLPGAIGASGLFLMMMGCTTSPIFLTVSFFLFFLTLPLINTSAEVLIRKGIPNNLQGRAWGMIGLLSQAGYILAYLSAGVLADRYFNPLLDVGGALAPSLGRLIGSGPGRGMGLMLILSGLGIVATASIGGRRGRSTPKCAAGHGVAS